MISQEESVGKNIFISNISVFSNHYTKAIEFLIAAIFLIIGMTKALSTDRTIKELEKYKDKIPELQNTIDILQQERKEIFSDIKSELESISSSIKFQAEDAEDPYARLPEIAEAVTQKVLTAGILPNWNLKKRSFEDKLRKKLKDAKAHSIKVDKKTSYWRLQDICKLLADLDNTLSQQEWIGELILLGTPKKKLKIRQ